MVDLSTSPTSLARSADLEADTRPDAVPGPGFVGTSPDLDRWARAPVRDAAAPVAATPGAQVGGTENVQVPPDRVALVSGATDVSFEIVAQPETGAMPSQVLSPAATPLASFQSIATDPSVAVPTGGGDAPEVQAAASGTGTAGGREALAATRAAAIIAAASQLPGADGAIIGDIVIVSDFTSLVPTSTVMAIVFCVGMMLAAFAAGWWCRGEAEAKTKAATLRPAIASAPSAPPAPPAVYPHRICTTKSGEFWHLEYKCHFLDLSSAILERSSCPVCVDKTTRHRSPQVAATSRGSDE